MDMENILFGELVRIDKTNIVCYIQNMFENRI